MFPAVEVALPGIDLQSTTGQFVVNGDGSNTSVGGNNSGGIIGNKTGGNGAGDFCAFAGTGGVGIYLNDVDSVVLNRMRIHNCSNFAVFGKANVDVFDMEYCRIDGTNGDSFADDEGSIGFL